MGKFITVKNFNHPVLDIYARTPEVQLLRYREPKPGIFIAESPKVIERALDAGYEPISFLMETQHAKLQEEELLKRCPGVPVYAAEPGVLNELKGFSMTRGTLCAMNRKPLPTVQEVCKSAKRIAILENVVNPTNVGAIVRSAAALGMEAVLFTSGCSNPLYRRAVRVSMGTIFQIPWTIMDAGEWPGQGMDQLRSLGFTTAAMALCDNSLSIDDKRLHSVKKLAVVLGTEGDGLAADTIAACDFKVQIPMAHGVDSLNVAAASAVAFWELRKRL